MYLSKTDLSIKEIAERLNFPDPAYMNRFFKSAIKISMTQYRILLRTESLMSLSPALTVSVDCQSASLSHICLINASFFSYSSPVRMTGSASPTILYPLV